MGYNTRYTLTVKPTEEQEGPDVEERAELVLLEAREWCPDLELAVDERGQSIEAIKWYTYERDMEEVSGRIRDWLFQLDGQGEEPGDVWRAWFLNARRYRVSQGALPEAFATELERADLREKKVQA